MHALLLRADQFELNVCLRINSLSRYASARGLFRVVSRLGDGVFWYTVMVVLAIIGGRQAALAMLHVGLTSLAGVALYSYLKNRLVRPRPFVSHGQIVCHIAPLDMYSFPSGHTLHAVLFTTMIGAYAPFTLWLLVPFALLVATSRVVLGLHYPSDVLAGAALGMLLALTSFAVVSLPDIVPATNYATLSAAWVG